MFQTILTMKLGKLGFALFNKPKNQPSMNSFSSLEQYFNEVIAITVLSLSKNYFKVKLLKEIDNIH